MKTQKYPLPLLLCICFSIEGADSSKVREIFTGIPRFVTAFEQILVLQDDDNYPVLSDGGCTILNTSHHHFSFPFQSLVMKKMIFVSIRTLVDPFGPNDKEKRNYRQRLLSWPLSQYCGHNFATKCNFCHRLDSKGVAELWLFLWQFAFMPTFCKSFDWKQPVACYR